MIKTFLHKGIEDFFYNGTKKGIKPKHAGKLELILDRLHAASEIIDMDYPGANLHKLNPKFKDTKKQIWAVSVSGNWRLTFKFYDGDAYIVNYA